MSSSVTNTASVGRVEVKLRVKLRAGQSAGEKEIKQRDKFEHGIPGDAGNIFLLLMIVSVQSISKSTYFGAETRRGVLKYALRGSCHWYSYWLPPDIFGQLSSVQKFRTYNDASRMSACHGQLTVRLSQTESRMQGPVPTGALPYSNRTVSVSKLIRLKKPTTCAASQSFASTSAGRLTASLTFISGGLCACAAPLACGQPSLTCN